MKKIFFSSAVALCSLAMVSCGGKGSFGGFSSNYNSTDSAAYAIGLVNGQMFAQNLSNIPGDSVDRKKILDGLADALYGNKAMFTEEEAQTFLQHHFERVENEVKAANTKEGSEFLAENKNKEGVQSTESGIQYKIEKAGEGEKPTSPADTVVVHYKGSTLDGKVFDSSYERKEPAKFALNRVIPGWTEAFQLMNAGSTFTIWIPDSLAYGERGPRSIGPNKTLRFDCELLEVHHAKEVK